MARTFRPPPVPSNPLPDATAPVSRCRALSATLADPARRGAAAYLRAAAGVVAFSVAAAAGLHAYGRTTRTFEPGPPEVLLVRDGRKALAAWRQRHEQGRILVHAGRFLHFVDDGREEAMQQTLTAPGRGAALDELLERTAGPGRYLWVAASAGIARQIIYVSPPDSLDTRLAALGWNRSALPASIPWEVFPRTLTGTFPNVDEQVIIEICASWFDDPRAPDPLGEVLASGLDPDLIVVNLAEDAEDVSESARSAARSLAAALGAKLPKRRR